MLQRVYCRESVAESRLQDLTYQFALLVLYSYVTTGSLTYQATGGERCDCKILLDASHDSPHRGDVREEVT
jgi:hypothetical protein